MKRVLAFALVLGAGSVLATTAHAEPPDQARNDQATFHPGHQGHLSSGREYPGQPATQFHEALNAEQDTYPTGPGGWAEQQSGGANDQRGSIDTPAGQGK